MHCVTRILPKVFLKVLRMRTSGSAALPPSTRMSPVITAPLEMRSNALTPSMDMTVALVPCKACATLTSSSCRQRTLVRRGGRHHCVSQLLGHHPRNQCPKHVARDAPPSDFDNAVILPTLTICTTDSGIKPREKTSLEEHLHRSPIVQKGRKCSFVMPEGPAAAPLREDRRHRRNKISSRSKGTGGTQSNTSLGNGHAARCQCHRVTWD